MKKPYEAPRLAKRELLPAVTAMKKINSHESVPSG